MQKEKVRKGNSKMQQRKEGEADKKEPSEKDEEVYEAKDERDEEGNLNMTERVKGIKGKEEIRTNVNVKDNRPHIEKQRLLIKFEIDKKNEGDAIKMARIIARAANLKKDSTHYVAKFLFEECLAEYRSEDML